MNAATPTNKTHTGKSLRWIRDAWRECRQIVGHSERDLGPLDFIHRKTTGEEFYFISDVG